jgi:hypothetical protein
MKSAFLVAKSSDFPNEASAILLPYFSKSFEGLGRMQISDPIEGLLTLYKQALQQPCELSLEQIPEQIAEQCYNNWFLVECRSEKLFCACVQKLNGLLDFMVCDSDANFFMPADVNEQTIVL